MKKGCLIAVVAVVVIVLGCFVWVKNTYNGFVSQQEGVDAAWSQVENVYQRRADLIPNLVATVKGYAKHEQETLDKVVSARAKATQITVDPENLNEASLKKYQEAQGELGSALGKLLAITENYPDLKANENFLQLQSQLEGTENRIAVARKEYNDAVKAFNVKVVTFPNNLIASWFGFAQKEFFAATESASNVPVVAF